MSSTSTPDTTPAASTVDAPNLENDEPQTKKISADATPNAPNDKRRDPDQQPVITEPTNDSLPFPEAVTGTD